MKIMLKNWLDEGTPWIWVNAGAVAVSIIMVLGLLLLLAVEGVSYFWPKSLLQAVYVADAESATPEVIPLLGEAIKSERVDAAQLQAAGVSVSEDRDFYQRSLIRVGNRDLRETDFVWVLDDLVSDRRFPVRAVTLERREWGNFYGFLIAVKEQGRLVLASDQDSRWHDFLERLDRAQAINDNIVDLENDQVGQVNYEMERLRLQERRLEMGGGATSAELRDLAARRERLNREYEALRLELEELYAQVRRDSAEFMTVEGERVEIPVADVVHAYRPNALGFLDKCAVFIARVGEFLTAEPREANTEGGIFPAIFGTVMMVMLMSVFVTPFGVLAAVYLSEYARQGVITRTIRVAVNNLAGVPSIVYGVFGLGFFIYFVGGEIDQLFYTESLPAPTFGTPGLLWASLTLALLTLPVVIVATEEGLARIPRSVREGSLALGATKFETLRFVVLPMASPAMITGLILAVARAAGEVAPLMLVGVVKLAPSLPLDTNFPYLHLEQKFMHLGFHIYDVGFQSPNIEAATPLVFATALLLVLVIVVLNLLAVVLRNRLRDRYQSLEV